MADKQTAGVLNQREVIALSNGDARIRDDADYRTLLTEKYGAKFTGKGRSGVQVPVEALIGEGILPEGTTFEDAKAKAATAKTSTVSRPRKNATVTSSGGSITDQVTDLVSRRKQLETVVARATDAKKRADDELKAANRELTKTKKSISRLTDDAEAEAESRLAQIRKLKEEGL